MLDFRRVGQEAESATKKAANDSRNKGLPVVALDPETGRVLRTWPDGRVEVVSQSVRGKSSSFRAV